MKKLLNRKIVRVEVRSLRIHPTAQKRLNPTKMRQIAEKLDLDFIGTLHAVEATIDGVQGIYVIDGQHRVLALLERGLGEWMVDVEIHLDAQTPKRASEIFLGLNKLRSTVPPYDTFLNELRAEDPAAVGIVACLEDRGIRVADGCKDGSVCCISALKKVWNLDSSGASLGAAVDVITGAWGRKAAAMEGKLIEGVGIVCGRYNGTLDKPALVKKLAKYSGGASGLLGDAKGLKDLRKSSVPKCVAELVIESYNKGRRVGQLDPL